MTFSSINLSYWLKNLKKVKKIFTAKPVYKLDRPKNIADVISHYFECCLFKLICINKVFLMFIMI